MVSTLWPHLLLFCQIWVSVSWRSFRAVWCQFQSWSIFSFTLCLKLTNTNALEWYASLKIVQNYNVNFFSLTPCVISCWNGKHRWRASKIDGCDVSQKWSTTIGSVSPAIRIISIWHQTYYWHNFICQAYYVPTSSLKSKCQNSPLMTSLCVVCLIMMSSGHICGHCAMPATFSFNDDGDDELSLLATSVATFYTLHPPPRLRMKSPARQRPSLLVSNWISRQFLAHFIPTNDQTTNRIFSMVSSCIICTACHINGLPVLRHMRHVVIWYLWHNNEKMTVQWWATY